MPTKIDLAVLGTAGSGKTTKVIHLTENENKRFAFVAFNKKIAVEVKGKYEDMPNISSVRTIDSLAHNIVSMEEEFSVADKEFKRRLKDMYAINLFDEDGKDFEVWVNYLKSRNSMFSSLNIGVGEGLGRLEIARRLEIEMKKRGLYTFQVMRERAYELLNSGLNYEMQGVDGIIVDEVQDVTKLQWEILSKVAKQNSLDIWVAGDINQTIYGHLGASRTDTKHVFSSAKKVVELKISHRVPVEMELSIKRRMQEYGLDPSKFNCYRRGGEIKFIDSRSLLFHFLHEAMGKDLSPDSLAVIFRTRKRVRDFKNNLRRQGIFVFPSDHIYHTAISLFRRIFYQNYDLTKKEKSIVEEFFLERPEEIKMNRFDINEAFYTFIQNLKPSQLKTTLEDYYRFSGGYNPPSAINYTTITTIHKMKGAERDIVFVDEYIPKTDNVDRFDEGCVKFVGLTRARRKMYIFS